jgi:hypothetical protein
MLDMAKAAEDWLRRISAYVVYEDDQGSNGRRKPRDANGCIYSNLEILKVLETFQDGRSLAVGLHNVVMKDEPFSDVCYTRNFSEYHIKVLNVNTPGFFLAKTFYKMRVLKPYFNE